MVQNKKLFKTPLQHAFQYTLLLSVLYAVIKFFDMDSPKGIEFISYILPMLFTEIILVVFPFLLVFFYFSDGAAMNQIKDNIFNGTNCKSEIIDTPEVLREYHNMLKEGILTQDEFEKIKKKYLKELNKD